MMNRLDFIVPEETLCELEAAHYDMRSYTRVASKMLETNRDDPTVAASPAFSEFMKRSGLAEARYERLKARFAEEMADRLDGHSWHIDFYTGVCHIED